MNAIHSILIKTISCVIAILICGAVMQAQHLGDQLKSQLQGKTKLAEVMTVVDSLYNNLTEEQRQKGYDGLRKYKHWMRWAWYMSRQLGPEGEFVNISKHNYDLIKARGNEDTPSTRSPIQGSWESLGPFECTESTLNQPGAGAGRVDRIAFDPVNANILYVGAPNGGLWKTYNGGESWAPLLDTFPTLGVSGVTVNPTNPNEIFVLTGVGDSQIGNGYQNNGLSSSLGVLKSVDGGESWVFTSPLPVPNGGSYLGYDLEQSHNNGSILLAATNVGIFRTNNSGANWTLVKAGYFYDTEFSPGSESIAYASTNNTIYRSLDNGTSWTECTLDMPPAVSSDRVILGVSPAAPTYVYALFGNEPGVANTFSGIYLSTNSGGLFSRQATSPNVLGNTTDGTDAISWPTNVFCMAVHPDSAHRVVIGCINVWHSTNSGDSFSYLKGWHDVINNPSLYVHVDQHAVAYNPLDNKLYMCNDGGVWVSNNNGATVTDISDGLVLSEFYHLTQDYAQSYTVAGGTQDNGTFFRNSGTGHYNKFVGGDGYGVAFVAGNPNKFYTATNSYLIRVNCITQQTTPLPLPNNDNLWGKVIVSHPVDSNIIFCAGINTIFKSTNQGTSWTNEGGKGSWAMAISPSDPGTMYAAGASSIWYESGGGAYKSLDGGDTWTLMSNNPGFPPLSTIVTDIAVHPYNPQHVTLTMGGFTAGNKVFHSGNGGANWINITYNLPNVVVFSIVTTPDGIFIGTGITVYFIVHGTNQWIDIGSNIPHAGITDLNYNYNSGTLIASTFGRGIWQRNVCVDDITLTYPLTGELAYSCDDQLVSSSFIPGNAIDSINFRANGSIKMTPGFNVKTGAHLKAKIESCDDGNIPYQGSQPETKATTTNLSAGLSKRKSQKEN